MRVGDGCREIPEGSVATTCCGAVEVPFCRFGGAAQAEGLVRGRPLYDEYCTVLSN